MIDFCIEGIPQPKQRPRHTRNGHTYTPDKTVQAEQNIKARYLELGLPYFGDNPLKISVIFYMPIPVSFSNKKRRELENEPILKHPDVDNLLKLLMDALNGVCYADDRQVWSAYATKRYSSRPRTEVAIWEGNL